jgi:hypothetical protein
VAGQDRPEERDDEGRTTYDRRYGEFVWGRDVVPEYRWFDGMRHVGLVGDTITPPGPVDLNAPAGEKRNPAARIFPFKAQTAIQPYDRDSQTLLLPELVKEGPAGVDWPAVLEGREFVETRMCSSVHHGVVPARRALGCADCHRPEAVSCSRCHSAAEGMDQPEHTQPVYPETAPRLDFEALEYEDDPAVVGGRFFLSLGRGAPPR